MRPAAAGWATISSSITFASQARSGYPLSISVTGSRAYKIRYRPMEKLGPHGWQRISAEEQDRLVHQAAGRREDGAPSKMEQARHFSTAG